jgi:cytoskeletal protein CcmA (bactofilin family)
MSIFEGKDKKDEFGQVAGEGVATIGPTHFVNGEVSGEENLVIKGYVKGRIDLKNHSLIIEKGGRVDGDIIVNELILRGAVNGNIYAAGKVLVAPEAHVRGDIAAARISISEGAVFKGSIKMEEGLEKVSAPKEKLETLSLAPSKETKRK